MNYINYICGLKPSIKTREKNDKFFFLPGGCLKFDNIADFYTRYIEKIQLTDTELWKRFVNQFRSNVDDYNNGWRCEYWGKLMRGACMVYEYTQDSQLYEIMTDTVKDLLTTQDADGRFSTYSVENEFHGWDVWGRKYIMLGLEYFYDICTDNDLKEKILEALEKHADYITEKIGVEDGKLNITKTSDYWEGLNSSSILEPYIRLYNLTKKKDYLDFSTYIIKQGATFSENIFELAYKKEKFPYQYPVTKAYEMMSCFEGLLEYYRVTGIEECRKSVENFVELLCESEITIIGSAGCEHELFNHSVEQQGNYDYASNGILQETCVTVTWMKLCSQLLCLNGDSKIADCMELSIYNALYGAVNSECSICNGGLPFDSYSPLFSQKRGRMIGGLMYMSDGSFYGCCAAIGAAGIGLGVNCAVMASHDGVVINMYNNGVATLKTPNKNDLKVKINSDYPFDGSVNIDINAQNGEKIALYLRIPAWSKKTVVTVDGKTIENIISGEYLKIENIGENNTVNILFDMTPQYINCPDFEGRIGELRPHSAIKVGPIILARDTRFKEDIAIPLNLDTKSVPNIKKSSDGNFNRNIEYTLTDKDGNNIHLTDYSSAGKTLNDDSRLAVWLPLKR